MSSQNKIYTSIVVSSQTTKIIVTEQSQTHTSVLSFSAFDNQNLVKNWQITNLSAYQMLLKNEILKISNYLNFTIKNIILVLPPKFFFTTQNKVSLNFDTAKLIKKEDIEKLLYESKDNGSKLHGISIPYAYEINGEITAKINFSSYVNQFSIFKADYYVEKEAVANFYKIFCEMNIDISFVVPESLASVYESCDSDVISKGLIAIDIGMYSTNISFISRGFENRTIPGLSIGFDKISTIIGEKLNVKKEAILKSLDIISLNKASDEAIQRTFTDNYWKINDVTIDDLSNAYKEAIQSIFKSINTFLCSMEINNLNLKNIYLYGGVCQTKGIKEFIEQCLNNKFTAHIYKPNTVGARTYSAISGLGSIKLVNNQNSLLENNSQNWTSDSKNDTAKILFKKHKILTNVKQMSRSINIK